VKFPLPTFVGNEGVPNEKGGNIVDVSGLKNSVS